MTINPIPVDKKYHQIYTVDKETADFLYESLYDKIVTKIEYINRDNQGNITSRYYWLSWRK